jgi:hypothetical protein
MQCLCLAGESLPGFCSGLLGDLRNDGMRRIALIAFVAFGLYVTSVGPALWLCRHNLLSLDGFVMSMYAPLDWVHKESSTARGVLDWYAELFVSRRR